MAVTGAPPKAATEEFLSALEDARRLVGLRVSTLARAVVDPDDVVGWARLATLGTAATVQGQQAAADAVIAYAMATLEAAGAPLDPPVSSPVATGRLGSGRDVRGLFEATSGVVEGRMAGGLTFGDALAASADYLVGVAASEPHRIGRDGLLRTGTLDDRFERFRRVAEGGACDFCRMLATRGAVYLSAATAGEARKYHTHCRCHIELVVGADAIEASQELQGDWRNAAKDDQRLIDAGAMTGVTSDAVQLMETARTSGGWLPGNWAAATEDEVTNLQALPAHLAAKLRLNEHVLGLHRRQARPLQHMLKNGNKTVALEQKLSPAQLAGLLADFDEAIAAMPASVRGRPVSLATPVGDPTWKKRAGGYVMRGSPRINIKPAIAKGAESWADQAGFHPPAFTGAKTRRDVIMHEMGHVVDDMLKSTGMSMGDADRTAATFWRDIFRDVDGWRYGKSNAAEGYAEAFFQYHVGGPGSSPVADAYAARYGWS